VTDIVIRPWQADDADALDGLLDSVPNSFFLTQRAGRYGMQSRPDRLAVTMVAQDATGLVGVATLFHNPYHPDRYPALVEVAPRRRREGIGRWLVAAIAAHRPEPRPMAGKIDDADVTAMRFADALGMRTYQHCPRPTTNPSDPQVKAWAAAQPAPPAAQVVPLSEVDPAAAVDAIVSHYQWVHEHWSPMGQRDLIADLWTAHMATADTAFSHVALVDGRISALCLAWVDGEHAEAVAETATRHEPDGTALVTACVARTLTALNRAALTEIEFDGHDDDPHLSPVIEAMPCIRRDPISLVEISW
jgi:hypothetical protein